MPLSKRNPGRVTLSVDFPWRSQGSPSPTGNNEGTSDVILGTWDPKRAFRNNQNQWRSKDTVGGSRILFMRHLSNDILNIRSLIVII